MTQRDDFNARAQAYRRIDPVVENGPSYGEPLRVSTEKAPFPWYKVHTFVFLGVLLFMMTPGSGKVVLNLTGSHEESVLGPKGSSTGTMTPKTGEEAEGILEATRAAEKRHAERVAAGLVRPPKPARPQLPLIETLLPTPPEGWAIKGAEYIHMPILDIRYKFITALQEVKGDTKAEQRLKEELRYASAVNLEWQEIVGNLRDVGAYEYAGPVGRELEIRLLIAREGIDVGPSGKEQPQRMAYEANKALLKFGGNPKLKTYYPGTFARFPAAILQRHTDKPRRLTKLTGRETTVAPIDVYVVLSNRSLVHFKGMASPSQVAAFLQELDRDAIAAHEAEKIAYQDASKAYLNFGKDK